MHFNSKARLIGTTLLLLGGSALFTIAFLVLREMRTSGLDPAFKSDWDIVKYLAAFAALIVGGCILWALTDRVLNGSAGGRRKG